MRVAIAVVMLAALGGSAAAHSPPVNEHSAKAEPRPADKESGIVNAPLEATPAARAELARRHGDALSRRQAELKAFHGGCPVDAAAAQGGLDPNSVGRRYGALILLLTPPAAFLGLLSLQHRRHRRQAPR